MSSEEVAEDYALALQALTLNSRYEISNLTVIAKENTEHALAISEAVKNHIKQTSPQKKLPAFYVLDSVVKNVGTPYTLFFGRQLYSTFMEAYALVDNNVRRKMDEMLKTWKEPVPGSMDTRPVFPPDVTRPIENALIKAKTSYVQAHQEHLRSQQQYPGAGRPSPVPYQQTPTPPNAYRPQQQVPGYAPPQGYPPQQQQYPPNGQQYSPPPNFQQYPLPQNQQQYPPPTNGGQYPPNGQQYPTPPNGQQYSAPQNGPPGYGLPPRPPSQQYSQPPPNQGNWQQYPPQGAPQGYQPPEDTIGPMNADLERLIAESRAAWSQNVHDTVIGTRLKALLDLQSILQNQKLPPDQIELIRNQVNQLSEVSKPKPVVRSPPPPVAAAQPPSLDTLLGPGALAALMARQHSTPQPQIPHPIRSPQPPRVQPSYQPPPATPSNATPVPDTSSLLERLRAAGMLPGAPPATATPTPLSALPGFPPRSFTGTPPTSRTRLAVLPNDVVLKPASLKIPRPHLISALYERLGVPCTQCGRRFQSDPEGKKKKEAHMDWHFKVRRRMEEAESRGQYRSWYVDELDWIKSRETNDESGDIVQSSSTENSPAKKKVEYLPVPDDPDKANSVCPICQEKFEMKWLDEAQEFVWMDTRMVREKVYHATCYAEATKDVSVAAKRGGGTPEPGSVLGKRKAEDDYIALRNKIKTEP